uniref:Uncharacterized protein n=1 Tax=Tanacetum cinerariifolium TaxID=118510 RepID=A0A6L2MDX4_TANCI|nr:hypothetical protein [Tanacetum cinerariifolium]
MSLMHIFGELRGNVDNAKGVETEVDKVVKMNKDSEKDVEYEKMENKNDKYEDVNTKCEKDNDSKKNENDMNTKYVIKGGDGCVEIGEKDVTKEVITQPQSYILLKKRNKDKDNWKGCY